MRAIKRCIRERESGSAAAVSRFVVASCCCSVPAAGRSRDWLRVLLLFWVISWPVLVAGQEAKVAPSAAETAKSSPAAQTMYADAANYQNNRAFDLAAEEWKRFLERFGDDPLAAKARHYRGVCLVQLKQYVEAVTEFQTVIAQHPQFELLEDCYLNLGWSQYSLALAGDQNRYAQAVETFNTLKSAFPEGKNVDQAIFFEAESLYALDRKKDSALAYGRLVTEFPESKMRADALYALGVTLEEMQQWAQAVKAYEMFLTDYAKNDLATEVTMRKAEAILQGGDPKTAAGLFAEVAAAPGFAAADHALLRQAYCAAQRDNLAEAAALYAALPDRFPESANAAEARLSAGRCFYRMEKFEDATAWFDQAVSAGGAGSVEAAHWRCRIYLRNHEVDQAIALADRMLPEAGDDPFAPNLQLDKADALYESAGGKAESLQQYLAISQAHPSHEAGPVALYNAAFTALELKEYDQASALASKFLTDYPTHTLLPDVQYVVAECLVQQKQYEQAEGIYRQLVDTATEHADNPLWRVRLGLVIYLQKNYQAAIDLLTPAVPLMPNPPLKAEALFLIGVSQFLSNQGEAAATSLSESMLTDAKWRQADETLLYLARAQQKQGQLAEAIGTLGNLLNSFPESGLLDQAFYHLGECHYGANDFAAAIAAYDQLLQRYAQSPYVPFAMYGKGWALLKAGDFEQASVILSTLVQQHADHELADDALFARGMCYRQAEKYAEAIADLDQYLAANPNGTQRPDALYERGLCEASAGKNQQAVDTYTLLLQEFPAYPHTDKVLYELAWAYQVLPDPDAAAKTFATLVEKYPDNHLAAEAGFHVGEHYYRQADYASAIKAYQQSAQSSNTVVREKAIYKLGWAHYEMKAYREALVSAEELIASYGDGELASDAWFLKGECLLRLGEFEGALPAYQEALGREPSSPQIGAVRQLHAAQAAGQLEKWQESLDLLAPLFEKYAESPVVVEAYFERGQARQKLNQLDEAIADFRQAAERSRQVVGIRAQFMVGEVEFQQKRYADAIKDFQRTMFRALPEEAPAEFRTWQAKAGYEAGRCSEVQIQEAKSSSLRAKFVADAKKFYQYVVESHPEDELAAEAKKRLEALAKLTP